MMVRIKNRNKLKKKYRKIKMKKLDKINNQKIINKWILIKLKQIKMNKFYNKG